MDGWMTASRPAGPTIKQSGNPAILCFERVHPWLKFSLSPLDFSLGSGGGTLQNGDNWEFMFA
jgi:hypothetical protein